MGVGMDWHLKWAGYLLAAGFGAIAVDALPANTPLFWVGATLLACSVLFATQDAGRVWNGRPRNRPKHQAAVDALSKLVDGTRALFNENPQNDREMADSDGRYETWAKAAKAVADGYDAQAATSFKEATIDPTGNVRRPDKKLKQWSWKLDILESQRAALEKTREIAQARLTWAK